MDHLSTTRWRESQKALVWEKGKVEWLFILKLKDVRLSLWDLLLLLAALLEGKMLSIDFTWTDPHWCSPNRATKKFIGNKALPGWKRTQTAGNPFVLSCLPRLRAPSFQNKARASHCRAARDSDSGRHLLLPPPY